MKRIALVAVFAVLGLLSTWSGLFLASRIDFTALVGERERIRSGCWEIDHCNVSSGYIALALGVLLLPTLVHGVVGYVLARRNASLPRYLLAGAMLLATTCLFYAVATFLSRYA